MGFVKMLDKAPLWVKIVLALPVLDIVWAIYRIVKGAVKGDFAVLLGGILWLLLGWGILWVIDLISVIGWKKLVVLA